MAGLQDDGTKAPRPSAAEMAPAEEEVGPSAAEKAPAEKEEVGPSAAEKAPAEKEEVGSYRLGVDQGVDEDLSKGSLQKLFL